MAISLQAAAQSQALRSSQQSESTADAPSLDGAPCCLELLAGIADLVELYIDPHQRERKCRKHC